MTGEELDALEKVGEGLLRDHQAPCILGRVGEAIVEHVARERLAGGLGPAQVATPSYRAAWDVTFGGKKPARGVA